MSAVGAVRSRTHRRERAPKCLQDTLIPALRIRRTKDGTAGDEGIGPSRGHGCNIVDLDSPVDFEPDGLPAGSPMRRDACSYLGDFG